MDHGKNAYRKVSLCGFVISPLYRSFHTAFIKAFDLHRVNDFNFLTQQKVLPLSQCMVELQGHASPSMSGGGACPHSGAVAAMPGWWMQWTGEYDKTTLISFLFLYFSCWFLLGRWIGMCGAISMGL